MEDTDSPADGDCTDSGDFERLYYTTDANMNVTALVDTSGAVVERYVYDPYGKVTIYDPNWDDTKNWGDSKKNEILYCGYRYDPETGHYHVRNRYYHPTLGRWLQRDKEGYVDGMSLYEYLGSMPGANADPYGLERTPGEGGVGDFTVEELEKTGMPASSAYIMIEEGSREGVAPEETYRKLVERREEWRARDKAAREEAKRAEDARKKAEAQEGKAPATELSRWLKELTSKVPIIAKTTGWESLEEKLLPMLDKYKHKRADKLVVKGQPASAAFVIPTFGNPYFKFQGGLLAYEGESIFHEVIHALDYSSHWYADHSEKELQSERLAWGAAAVHGYILTVHGVEMYLVSNKANRDLDRLTLMWDKAWRRLGDHWNNPGYNVYWSGGLEQMSESTLRDVDAKLKVRVSCSSIQDALSKEYGVGKECLKCPENLPNYFKGK